MKLQKLVTLLCAAILPLAAAAAFSAAMAQSLQQNTVSVTERLAQSAAPDVITIGLIDAFSPNFYVSTYAPTIDRLMERMPEQKFRLIEVDPLHAAAEIDKEKPDFVICSASTYASLASSHGAQQIGTRMTPSSESVFQSVASVFIVKADSDFRSLSDLRGTTVAVSDTRSFEGWLIAQGELARQGLDPDDYFSNVLQTHYSIPDVTTLVTLGLAQVGVLSSEQYENLQRLEPGKAARFRVIAARNDPGEPVRSTDRYPDAVFSSLPWAQSKDVSTVTVALLSMSSRNDSFHWEVCNDFVPTMQLLKTLAIGPYNYLKDMSPWGLAKRFKVEILLFLLLLVAAAFHIVTVNVLVRRRTAQLTEAVDEIQRSHLDAERNRKRIVMLERAGVVSQVSTLFAHEIKQPVMNIVLYCEALRMYLRKQNLLTEKAAQLMDCLKTEVDRTSAIVHQVRSYAKKQERTVSCCNLTELARKAATAAGNPDICWGDLPEAFVLADPFEVQFVCTNFIKNAADAVQAVDKPTIRIDIHPHPQGWALSVTDNGPVIDDKVFAQLGKITSSSKPDGLGFGLAIASSIAEINGGHLEFKREKPSGLSASIVLRKCIPAADPQEETNHDAMPD